MSVFEFETPGHAALRISLSGGEVGVETTDAPRVEVELVALARQRRHPASDRRCSGRDDRARRRPRGRGRPEAASRASSSAEGRRSASRFDVPRAAISPFAPTRPTCRRAARWATSMSRPRPATCRSTPRRRFGSMPRAAMCERVTWPASRELRTASGDVTRAARRRRAGGEPRLRRSHGRRR